MNDIEVISDVNIEDNSVEVEENVQLDYLDTKVLDLKIYDLRQVIPRGLIRH